MVPAAGGPAATVGSELLIFGDDGRIQFDYQFLEPPLHSDELDQFVSAYLSIWNESDAHLRRKGVATLRISDGVYLDPSTEDRGHNGIEASIADAHDELVAKGLLFVPGRYHRQSPQCDQS
jgi:hypothetical protein